MCAQRVHAPAGSTFELLVVACSRAGVNTQVFAEQGSLNSVNLPQPVTGWPVSTCLLPGVLSMQVVLEESSAAAAAAAATSAGTQAANSTQ
jgi:hypothetical protein